MSRLLNERPAEKGEELVAKPAAEAAALAPQGVQPNVQQLLALQKSAGNAAVTRYLRSLKSGAAGAGVPYAAAEQDAPSGPKDASVPRSAALNGSGAAPAAPELSSPPAGTPAVGALEAGALAPSAVEPGASASNGVVATPRTDGRARARRPEQRAGGPFFAPRRCGRGWRAVE